MLLGPGTREDPGAEAPFHEDQGHGPQGPEVFAAEQVGQLGWQGGGVNWVGGARKAPAGH